MKNTIPEWCLLILTLTIPVSLIGMIFIQMWTGMPISPEAGSIVMDMLKVIGGGVLTILGGMFNGGKTEEK